MDYGQSKLPSYLNYLCIEGVIGAGKTSLCKSLSEIFDARQVLEEVDENPFLSGFYKDRNSFAFQTQLWFLLSRYKQLSVMVAQQDLFHKITMSDYLFAKDRIFANINLKDDELSLYNNIARVLETSIPKPDLVVYLQASTDVLLKRIEKRGRKFEFNMDPEYIDTLNEAYNHYFFHYTSSPLLIINTNDIDFVNEIGDLQELIDQIVSVKSGSHYYHPLGSKDRLFIEERQAAAKNNLFVN
ncbi:deoxynucleoside kinase [Chitinispirillales bacterium ANBcel5]|uniref:deoxynucleoside kinase n=1 Tax=Cellulosispirillum alkaliphilum TaxID=3039283 RepID=UPI002A562B55|nr:deoxynucleoside kinase [Chitinispirillales bacterium ANBcel5]